MNNKPYCIDCIFFRPVSGVIGWGKCKRNKRKSEKDTARWYKEYACKDFVRQERIDGYIRVTGSK